MEIERKFLVKETPDLKNIESEYIIQSYISYEPEIRVRKKSNKYYITKKSSGSLIRNEEETEINEIAYNILSSLIKNKLEKKRYIIKLPNKLNAELDIYQDKLEGLKVVEVEFNNIDEADNFIIPDWFGEEITDNLAFKNQNLAKK
jgi:CYTH domain-containing protein